MTHFLLSDLLRKLMEDDDKKEESPPPRSTASSILRAWSSRTAESRLQRKNAFLRRRPTAVDHGRSQSVANDNLPVALTEKAGPILPPEIKIEGEEKGETANGEKTYQSDTEVPEDKDSYQKLEAVAKALADGGKSGLDTLRGALEQENVRIYFLRFLLLKSEII